MNEDLLELLKEELEAIKRASEILKLSFNNCSKIGIKNNYDANELLQYEGLTARFSRLSDIIIQKCLRTINQLESETEALQEIYLTNQKRKELLKMQIHLPK